MPLRVDREQNEVRALEQVADWGGLSVLEVGCGDGRLTRRLARLGARVQAVDPNAELIRAARERLPVSLAGRVCFAVGTSGQLKYAKGTFDTVVFSWSL